MGGRLIDETQESHRNSGGAAKINDSGERIYRSYKQKVTNKRKQE